MTDAANRDSPAGLANVKQVRTSRASEDVVAQIKRAFFNGMKPGDWVGTEADLAQRFGVSRITIRDAVRTLEVQGVVDVKVGAGGGLRVSEGDLDKFADGLSIQLHLLGITWRELTEAMLTIEPLTAKLAAQRATPDDVARMRATLADAESHVAEPETFTNTSLDFHLLVADAAGNRALRTSIRALRSLQSEKFQPNTSTMIAKQVSAAHAAIADAIAAGDADGAYKAMREHLESVAQHEHDALLI